MKFTSFTLLSFATSAVASSRCGELYGFLCSNNYLGVSAVHDDISMAVCGEDLQGCLTYDHQNWLTDRVRFGDYANIGTNQQIWSYDKGVLKNLHSGSCVGIVQRDRSEDYFEDSPNFNADLTHAVRMYECDPENLGQRWIIGEDDMRLHAFADDDLCLNIRSDNMETPENDKLIIDLAACTSNTNEQAHRQQLKLVGNPNAIQSFVHPSQTDYGSEDTVRLAFWLNSDDEVAMDPSNGRKLKLQVFLADGQSGDKPVHYQSCKDDRVTVVSAAKLLASVPDVRGQARFVARFGEVESEPFTIHSDEMHIKAKVCNPDNDEKVMTALAVVGSILLLAVGAFMYNRKASPVEEKASPVEVSANKVMAADEDDAMTQGSEEEP